MKSAPVVALLVTLLAVPAAAAERALSITFSATKVTVSGATPHAQILIFSMAREKHEYWSSSVRRNLLLKDDRGDGSVSYDLGMPVPQVSIWAAFDLKSGQWAVSAPAGRAFQPATFRANPVQQGNQQDDDRIRYGREYGEFLWVRPGVGAWTLNAADGGPDDADGKQDGAVTINPSTFVPVGTSPPPDKKFKSRDIVIIIDSFNMDVFSMEVQQ